METLVPGRMPRAGLLLLPLLLCFGPETAGRFNTDALRDIVNYVDQYAVRNQYAFAVSLNRTYCRNASGLEQELPVHELQQMRNATNQAGGLYDPADGHIVAAVINTLENGAVQHAEWRLLQGNGNSPVQKLLARTYNKSSCLIFFTLNSPCAGTCLAEKGPYSILQMVNNTFRPFKSNYKAFVFRQIYWQNKNLYPKSLLQAWHRLPVVPLYHCNKTHCSNCRGNDPSSNDCLDGM